METKVDEIAAGIFRLSTYVPDIAPPAGMTFNQFIVLGDEPLMFHTGLRRMFGLSRDAVQRTFIDLSERKRADRSMRARADRIGEVKGR